MYNDGNTHTQFTKLNCFDVDTIQYFTLTTIGRTSDTEPYSCDKS